MDSPAGAAHGGAAPTPLGGIALVGGDEFRPDCLPMDRDLLRRVGAPKPRVALVPTAAAHSGPRQAAENGVRYFTALGAQADAVMLLVREDARRTSLLAQLEAADVIYLTGGDPSYLLETLRGTAAEEVLRGAVHRGALVVGSSAGAMVLGAQMRSGRSWQPALGIAGPVAVLPHFRQMAFGDPAALAAALPSDVALLGIPVGVACYTQDGRSWQVLGRADVLLHEQGRQRTVAAWETFTLPGF